jgi:uncharacterized alpha-E superfamily protein
MLSRVAEHIYWLARYAERAENTARLINVNTHLQLDLPKHLRPGWEPLITITGSDDIFTRRAMEANEKNVVRYLIGDHENPSSIIQSLKWARENGRTVRDFFPRNGWEQINNLYRIASAEIYLGISPRGRYNYLKQIILGSQALSGMLSGTMSHDEGYTFLLLGRYIERADMTTRIVDTLSTHLEQQSGDIEYYEGALWMNLLESLSGYQMYRRVMQQAPDWDPVISFLFRNREFPRSFRYCLGGLADALEPLRNNEQVKEKVEHLEKLIGDLDPDQISGGGLHLLIDDLQLMLGEIHNEIGVTYFNYPVSDGQQQQQMG